MRRVLALLLLLPLATLAAPAPEDPAARAVAFLAARQGTDGGVADPWLSSWTALALAAARADGHDFSAGGASLAAYLAATDAGVSAGPAALEDARAVLVAAALGEDPRDFAGADRLARLLSHHDGRQFGSATAVNDDVWGIFALRAAGLPPADPRIQSAATALLAAQRPEGGWGIAAGAMPDADSTGWVLNALAAADRTGDHLDEQAVERGLAYLAGLREPAGFRQCLAPGCAGPNAESTASALVALHALGRGEDGAFDGTRAALLAFQREDGAFYRTATSTSWEFATPQALVALGGAYPPARRFDPQAQGAPVSPVTGESVRLSASAQACAWRTEGRVVEGCSAKAAWSAPGPRAVLLRAWDGKGGYARQVLEVDVRDAPPVAVLAAEAAVPKRRPVAFDGVASSDAEGPLSAWRFSFGDGAETGWQGTPLASHAYAASGTYTVRLTVRDAAGQEAASERILRVRNAAPLVSVEAPETCRPHLPLRLVALGSDADGDALRLRWETPDGEVEGAVLERAFPPGAWTLRAWAVDEEGSAASRPVALACTGEGGVTRVEEAPAVAPRPARAPVLRLDAPGPVVAGEALVVTGRVEDDAPGVRAQVAAGALAVEAAVEGGRLTARLEGLPPGVHLLSARAVDVEGLASEVAEALVKVEAAPPEESAAPRPTPAAPLFAPLSAWAAARLRRARR